MVFIRHGQLCHAVESKQWYFNRRKKLLPFFRRKKASGGALTTYFNATATIFGIAACKAKNWCHIENSCKTGGSNA